MNEPVLSVVLTSNIASDLVARLEGRTLLLNVDSCTEDRLWAVRGAAEAVLSSNPPTVPPGARRARHLRALPAPWPPPNDTNDREEGTTHG